MNSILSRRILSAATSVLIGKVGLWPRSSHGTALVSITYLKGAAKAPGANDSKAQHQQAGQKRGVPQIIGGEADRSRQNRKSRMQARALYDLSQSQTLLRTTRSFACHRLVLSCLVLSCLDVLRSERQEKSSENAEL